MIVIYSFDFSIVKSLHKRSLTAIAEKNYELGRDLLETILVCWKRHRFHILLILDEKETDNKDFLAMYNLACCQALLNNPFEALEELENALKYGYTNFEQIYNGLLKIFRWSTIIFFCRYWFSCRTTIANIPSINASMSLCLRKWFSAQKWKQS